MLERIEDSRWTPIQGREAVVGGVNVFLLDYNDSSASRVSEVPLLFSCFECFVVYARMVALYTSQQRARLSSSSQSGSSFDEMISHHLLLFVTHSTFRGLCTLWKWFVPNLSCRHVLITFPLQLPNRRARSVEACALRHPKAIRSLRSQKEGNFAAHSVKFSSSALIERIGQWRVPKSLSSYWSCGPHVVTMLEVSRESFLGLNWRHWLL